MRRLLVPLDGSSLAESVLPTVEAIAVRAGAEVVLIHVLEASPPATIHGEPHLADPGSAAAYLDRVAQKLASSAIQVETHVHTVREGDVARSIVEHAEEYAPDLVVLCAHGPNSVRGMIAGRLGQQVLHRGSCPTLIVQSSHGRFEPKKILVPLDGDPEHETSLHLATEMALLFAATILLMVVVPTVDTIDGDRQKTAVALPNAMRAILELAEEEGVEYLQKVGAALVRQGVPVEALVVRGDALGAMRNRDYDLVVMASHGRTGVSALLAESLGPRLQAQSQVPVLLVRA